MTLPTSPTSSSAHPKQPRKLELGRGSQTAELQVAGVGGQVFGVVAEIGGAEGNAGEGENSLELGMLGKDCFEGPLPHDGLSAGVGQRAGVGHPVLGRAVKWIGAGTAQAAVGTEVRTV